MLGEMLPGRVCFGTAGVAEAEAGETAVKHFVGVVNFPMADK